MDLCMGTDSRLFKGVHCSSGGRIPSFYRIKVVYPPLTCRKKARMIPIEVERLGECAVYEYKRCVLLADDEARIVRALKDLLTANGFYVFTALDGQEALEVFEQHSEQIDLVLLDVMMPKLDGFGVLRELKTLAPKLPVMMLTARGGEYDELQGLQGGADDYIAKPFSTPVLLARMESVLRRSGLEKVETIELGGIVLTPEQQKVEVDRKPLELTRREFALLHFFMSHAGILLSRSKLLEQVWGYDFEGDERTVDTHVKNLRVKLGEKSVYLHTIYRMGYKFEVVP